MSPLIARFNQCKNSIGQLLVRYDQELTSEQKSALGRAWANWSLVDRVGRARARKIVSDVLGNKARDVLDQLDAFNKENKV